MRSTTETFIGSPCGKGHSGERYSSTGMCVECSKAWYQKNKERKAKEYLEEKDKNKKRKSEQAKQYYQKNKERILAQQKEYYETNIVS